MEIKTTVELNTFDIANTNSAIELVDFVVELDNDIGNNFFTVEVIYRLMDKIVWEAPEEGELEELRDKFLKVARGIS